MKKFICVLCKKKKYGFGNNPYPLKEKGRCCDECNGKVIIARLTNHAKNLGRLGGRKTLNKYGKKHFSQIGKIKKQLSVKKTKKMLKVKHLVRGSKKY